MILSHQLKLIHLKTRKTAGTSMEVALERHCGPDDIVTPIDREQVTMDHRPRNWMGTPMRNHADAAAVRIFAGADVFDAYHKIAIERNPWDKCVSMYWHKFYSAGISGPFEAWLLRALEENDEPYVVPQDSAIYCLDGKIAVDRVLRYERLALDVEALSEYLGKGLDLPRALAFNRRAPAPYQAYYTQRSMDAVAKRFAFEIETFGYCFEDQR